ncbi:MAG: TetR/AcrR family transcriptional regulator [Alphaproteobacteria bacterium]
MPRRAKSAAILDSAERMARTVGFNAFSFRDVAEDIGIRSASVHYHFPTKTELGIALTRRFAERLMAELGDADDADVPPSALLDRYVAAFRQLVDEGAQTCLCTVLAAEIGSLPPELAAEVRSFFGQLHAWLTRVFVRMPAAAAEDSRGGAEVDAVLFQSAVQGGLLLAHARGSAAIYDIVAGAAKDRAGA